MCLFLIANIPKANANAPIMPRIPKGVSGTTNSWPSGSCCVVTSSTLFWVCEDGFDRFSAAINARIMHMIVKVKLSFFFRDIFITFAEVLFCYLSNIQFSVIFNFLIEDNYRSHSVFEAFGLVSC